MLTWIDHYPLAILIFISLAISHIQINATFYNQSALIISYVARYTATSIKYNVWYIILRQTHKTAHCEAG